MMSGHVNLFHAYAYGSQRKQRDQLVVLRTFCAKLDFLLRPVGKGT